MHILILLAFFFVIAMACPNAFKFLFVAPLLGVIFGGFSWGVVGLIVGGYSSLASFGYFCLGGTVLAEVFVAKG
jgi:mannose/fructose/N-acetylgalactosamine-specific phosphotransferase system component IIC